jgi:hypothetical protein
MATLSAVEDAASHGHSDLRALTLAALGVVYGDIGTSPLYALREAAIAAAGIPVGVWIEQALDHSPSGGSLEALRSRFFRARSTASKRRSIAPNRRSRSSTCM